MVHYFCHLSKREGSAKVKQGNEKQFTKFNWDGIDFPVSIKQIDKFERQNNYAINVFGYEGLQSLSINRDFSHVTYGRTQQAELCFARCQKSSHAKNTEDTNFNLQPSCL